MKTVLALSSAFLLALSGTAGAGPAKSPAGQEGSKAKVTRTVKIEMTEYAFSQKTLDFKAGETVKFIVSNKGKLKHELTIGTAEEQLAHRKAMEGMSSAAHEGHGGREGHGEHGGHGGHDGHGGHHGMDHDMPAGSIHVDPGATKELIWTFTKAGKLQFACNYPGHADLGMEGSIAVN